MAGFRTHQVRTQTSVTRAELDDALAEVVVVVVVVVAVVAVVVVVAAVAVADVIFAVEDVLVLSIVGSASCHFLVGRLSAHVC